MKTIISDVYENNRPSLERLRRAFPEHGEGLIEHTSTLRDQFVFQIQLVRAMARYEVLIRRRPHYGGHSEDIHSTHRYDIGTPRERICIKEEAMPKDLPTAVALAMWWAECTSRYIRNGRPWNGGAL